MEGKIHGCTSVVGGAPTPVSRYRPVALWPATTEAETVRFNLINPKTNNRIRMQTLDAGTGEEVSRGDLVKGFQIAKGEYVLSTRTSWTR